MSLDDSLTSIQWLCQLDSNKLLDDEVTETCQAESSSQDQESPQTPCQLAAVQDQEDVVKNPYPKPQYSYATLIVFAINSSIVKRMTLQEIYTWIQDNYPYYKFAKKGWKNSIRHNLSLHKFFIKEKRPSLLQGKGSFWRISPEGKENMMKDLLKQSQYNLQPPYALLPHDPNRKLRPIMPKPNAEGYDPRMQYVPFLTCNLPVVFVPTPALPPASLDGVPVGKGQDEATNSQTSTETIAQQHSKSSSLADSGKNDTKTKTDALPSSGTNPSETTRSPKQEHSQKSHCSQTKVNEAPGLKSTRSKPSEKTKQLPNILRRKRKASVRSPEVVNKVRKPQRVQTPRRLQPTLAAINSSNNHTTSSPKRSYDELVSSLTELTSSPLGHNSSFDFLNSFGSPGFSPLRSPGRIGTPDADSGIMVTPFKGTGFGELTFNWTPFKSGLTPVVSTPPGRKPPTCNENSQGCRKSLGLE